MCVRACVCKTSVMSKYMYIHFNFCCPIIQAQVLEDVCDASCQQSNRDKLQIMCTAPPVAVITDDNGNKVRRNIIYMQCLFIAMKVDRPV